MKKISIIAFFLIGHINFYAQVAFQEHLVSDDVQGSESVHAADIDGDGDLDLLATSRIQGNKVVWYENLDGQGNFGSEQIITTNIDGANTVYATDVDGDGDFDVLSTSYFDDKIAWYENMDGAGNFGLQQIITTSADNPSSVYADDLDGDGDMDILSSSILDDKIAWYENMDGLGNFGPQNTISTDVNGANSVHAADLDGDGDKDVLSAAWAGDKVEWYENLDGLGNFGSPVLITNSIDGASSVYSADMDADGDMDVLSSSWVDDMIAWYENTNGQGNFGIQHVVDTNLDKAISVFAADIDGDSDLDILAASAEGSTGEGIHLFWYENVDGAGNFPSRKLVSENTFGVRSAMAADLDGDNDMDVFSASGSLSGQNIVWYENLTVLGVGQDSKFEFSISPVPTVSVLKVKSSSDISEIAVFNNLGQRVKINFNSNQIDISDLNLGIYFVRIIDKQNNTGIQKTVKVEE